VPDAAADPARRGPGRPSEGAREAILAAALGFISGEGLSRLTTREVARRAGVSEASVFYHFRDKVGLVQEVILAGLEPLNELDAGMLAGRTGDPLPETLRAIAAALERFLDRAMPVVEALQADASLRAEFAARMAERDLGPHRGVRLVAAHLAEMRQRGAVRPDADTQDAALLLVGGCFLRTWQRHLTGREALLPSLDDATATLARLLSPLPPAGQAGGTGAAPPPASGG
jgi:AcrR family transcriptional regulator